MTIPSWARKGAKVVCVDDDTFFGERKHRWLDKGRVYTVVQARLGVGDVPVLDLEGIPPGFDLSRFRPAVSDDNEIETVIYRKRKDKLHQRVSTKSRERA